MNRYANVERVKEAQIVGILIGTVVCDNYMQIINRLKRAVLRAGKKYYEVLVGKINEPKLKNFQLIDLYVLISCPEQALVDFYQFNACVVMPHEALMALEPETYPWECKIITDFNVLLERGEKKEEDDQKDILEHQFEADEQALVAISKQNRELVPIFSSQVIEKYEQFSYKGL